MSPAGYAASLYSIPSAKREPPVPQDLAPAISALAAIGAPLQWLLLAAAAALLAVSIIPAAASWRGRALALTAALLVAGEALLLWFHWRLYTLAAIRDPVTGTLAGNVAVSPWVESEKLYVWALFVALLALAVRRHRRELLPGVGSAAAILTAGAVVAGRPFTQPLPRFLTQYATYEAAVAQGGATAYEAFQGMVSSMTYYYNAWYMWVHPPLLFVAYAAFVVSFVATGLMIVARRSAFEETAYRWARLGYLPLTAGMLLGVPWALMSWQGEAWWWSGKVNMSLMMWVLYTAYLHGRLYLRRRGMWKLVAALAVVSFLALVLTYVTTYVVPGAHSVAG